MRVLVCGGRKYDDREKVFATLDATGATVIIEGGAYGADRFAYQWAKRNLDVSEAWERYDAEWDKYGRSAGFLRNQKMIDEGKPDLVIAFPGGRGTRDMVRRAERAGIPVIEVSHE